MRTVTVTGWGHTRAAPDSAVVRVAVAHGAPAVRDAFAGADSAARLVAEIARRFTAPERIATTDVSLWPAHDNSGRRRGFEARHALSVRCPDLATAGGLLSALTEEVGDRLQVEGVSLELADAGTGVAAARALAFADARVRAAELAGLAEGALGAVVSVTEGGGEAAPVAAFARVAEKADATLEPGERTVDVSVRVTFELTDGS